MEDDEKNEIEALKEKVSQLEYELTHYKTNNEDLISKLAKADRQIAKVNSYNEELRLKLDTLSKELHEYRKSNTLVKEAGVIIDVPSKEIGIQVNSDDFEIVFESKALPDWTENSNQSTSIDTSSIAESLKATAEAVLHSNGSQPDSTTNYTSNYGDGYSNNQTSSYVWDENYQMYYDYNSGYYLDTANNLYYDPKTGTYFFYNDKTQKYEFHSQVSVNQDGESTRSDKPSSSSSRKSRSERHTDKSRSHIEKDNREVRQRSTPKKKEGSKHKKEKRHRSSSREQERSSKKRKKSKSRKHKKESKEEKRKKSSHRSRHSRSDENRLEHECCENTGVQAVKADDKKQTIDNEQNAEDVLEIESTEQVLNESMDTKVKIEHEMSINSDKDLEMGELERIDNEKSNLESKNVKKLSVVRDSLCDLESGNVEMEAKMEVSEEEANSVCTGESELESGELSSDSSDSDPDSEFPKDQSDDEGDVEVEMVVEKDIHGLFVPYSEEDLHQPGNEASISWPPCIRIMVNQSECLDIGDLFIVTCTGGTIGREKGRNHVIMINDINISRNHCSLRFDYTNNQYVVKDDGSQHGTFINDIRLSKAHEESTERGITHGDLLKLGTTELLLHIHPGMDTCLDCEPGEVKAKVKVKLEQGNTYVVLNAEEKKKQQKTQLNSIKKRYGLKNMKYEDNGAVNNPAYEDKAATRRKHVGSDGPGHKSEAPASVHKPISQKNKGHKLLAKMGWKEGEGLGKSSSGITDPINVTFRANQSAGFGSSTSGATSIDNVDGSATKKATIWKQTRERFDKINKLTVRNMDIFGSDSDVEKPKENG